MEFDGAIGESLAMSGASGRRVVACVDLSASSQSVVACARSLAAPDGKLVILHVAAPEPDFVGYKAGPDVVRRDVAKDLREEHVAVQGLADGVREQGLDVTPLTVQGATTEKILEHAERLQADFIVVASRGHRTLHDLIVGSVVREILRAATVPVVMVPWHPA